MIANDYMKMKSMSLTELIKQRRTIYQFTDDPVPVDQINSFLQCAISAPNHKLTQPWLFWVIGDRTQRELAHIYANNRALKHSDAETEGYQLAYRKAIEKFLSIPRIVMVGQILDRDPLVRQEDFAACSCAIQNFQLAAWEAGIGVQWSSGPIISDSRTYHLLDQNPERVNLIAALYLGVPKAIGSTERKSIDQVTTYCE